MKPEEGKNLDRNLELLMLVLDGEASEKEKELLQQLLEEDPELRAEWESQCKSKVATSEYQIRKPPDELWEEYMNSVYRRVERGIGWILLSLGAVVLISYGLWQGVMELVGDVTVPWYVKGGVLALLVGFVVLIVSVVREKFFVIKDDPFRKVKR